MSVQLGNNADEYVIADAVRIEAVNVEPPPPPPATAVIKDNGDAGFTTNWGYVDYTGEGYQNDMHYASAGDGSAYATWTFDVVPGEYQVAVNYPTGVNRATNTPYTVLDGTTSLGTTRVNQEVAPADFTDAGSGWKILGTYTITGNTLVVKLTNDADEYVIADAVRIVPVGGSSGGGTTTTKVTSDVYDDLDNLIEVIEPDHDGIGPLQAPTTHYTYDAAGQLLSLPIRSATSPPGNTTPWDV